MLESCHEGEMRPAKTQDGARLLPSRQSVFCSNARPLARAGLLNSVQAVVLKCCSGHPTEPTENTLPLVLVMPHGLQDLWLLQTPHYSERTTKS